MTSRWKALLPLFAAIAAVGGYWALREMWAAPAQSTQFKTAAVERGTLLVTVSATGTIEPEEVVDVGAQVAGKIQELGTCVATGGIVDYGSPVEPDAVLAKIDPALYDEEVRYAEAQLRKAKARFDQTKALTVEAIAAETRARADLVQADVKQRQADRDYQRAKKLAPNNTITQEQFDTALAAYESANAAVDVGKAAVAQTQGAIATARAGEEEAAAEVLSAEATLNRAAKNLEYTTIRSPIKGIVIDRRVNVGQTVLASLNAPSLFLIAKDLSKLQVWVSVNEADIGRLKVGQPVSFAVDAFPGETFQGRVTQIRLNASMTQNVVTYTVVVSVDNALNKLLPYLTANVKFEVARLDDVLTVPNAALRWTPRPEQIVPETRGEKFGKSVVWIREDDYVRPLLVKIGDSDGMTTAVTGDGIEGGLEVVVGETSGGAQQTVNPFLPQMQNKKKGGA